MRTRTVAVAGYIGAADGGVDEAMIAVALRAFSDRVTAGIHRTTLTVQWTFCTQ